MVRCVDRRHSPREEPCPPGRRCVTTSKRLSAAMTTATEAPISMRLVSITPSTAKARKVT